MAGGQSSGGIMNGPEHRWRKRLDERAEKRRAKRRAPKEPRNLLAELAAKKREPLTDAQRQAEHAATGLQNSHRPLMGPSYGSAFGRLFG